MVSKKETPLKSALNNLEEAIKKHHDDKSDSELPLLALTKAFEVAVEYGWRELKRYAENEGLEVQTPKEAVRQAMKTKCIDKPDIWITAINARNNSVHDYFGIGETEFVKIIESFYYEAKKFLNIIIDK